MDIARRLGLCIGTLAIWHVLMVAPAAAQSVPLFPAQVSSANIEALFGGEGSEEVTDIPLPVSGKAVLQSRVIRAAAGSRAAGRFAYQYRIDLSNATTLADSSCIANLSVKFGPIEKLPYAPAQPPCAMSMKSSRAYRPIRSGFPVQYKPEIS